MTHCFGRLTPDYDPWAGYAWPDRSGQAERAPRTRRAADAAEADASEPDAGKHDA